MDETPTRLIYAERLNRVLDYIAAHLDGDLSLENLARVACFSPYHFHRLFKGAFGETVHQHVQRQRLERSARLLKSAPDRTATEVALEVGYPGLSEFSRAFKKHFGTSPGAWDRVTPLPNSKICKAPEPFPRYDPAELAEIEARQEFRIRMKTFPRSRFAFFRVHDAYGNQRLVEAYAQLIAWLGSQGLGYRDVVIAGMSQDDPEVTPPEKCRYDMGALWPLDLDLDSAEPLANSGVLGGLLADRGLDAAALARISRSVEAWRPGGTPLAEGMSFRDFETCPAACVVLGGALDLFDRAYQFLFRHWLPESRYVPADLPGMELFRRVPEEIGWETFDIESVLPLAAP